jgi:hypothetical protein
MTRGIQIESGRISRRTVLRGLGTVVALPTLNAMLPRTSRGDDAATGDAASPRRMAFIYVPNGMHMQAWTPSEEGADYPITPILAPLCHHRDDLLVLSGLACDKARPNGDGAGDHARASSAFLTGAQARKTAGANFRSGVSADQIAAMRKGESTRLASLEVGIEQFRGTGNCDSGYSCVYEHTLAWRDPTTPLPTEANPQLVFDRLFSDRPNDPDRLKRSRLRASVLDAVLEDAGTLERSLGSSDKQKLDQYLTSVRDLEQRIARAEKLPPITLPEGTKRPGEPAELTEHFRLICDLLVLAFQTDVTRIATFMFGREGSDRSYPMVGVNEGHHSITHHQRKAELQAKIQKINTYHIEQFAYLLDRLKSVPDGDGTLLDQCMIAYGSAIADGDAHAHHDLPVLLAGRGGGTIDTGRHIRYSRDTPINNLWLSMLERFDCPTPRLGDSTGLLDRLS